MRDAGWYLVAYDIANPRRLQKIHRLLKKEGLAVQKSLFFVQGHVQDVTALLDRLAVVLDSKKDDLRAYPITHPKEVWTTGGPLVSLPLIQPGQEGYRGKSETQGKTKFKTWLKQRIGWKTTV